MDRQDQITYQDQTFYPIQFNSELELEDLVTANFAQIFPQPSFFYPFKKRLGNPGGQTIPDGYLIDFTTDGQCQVKLVEVELSHHHAYNHIMAQMGKFNSLNGSHFYQMRQFLLEQADLPDRKLQLFKQLYPNPDIPLPTILISDHFTPAIIEALQKLQHPPQLIQVKKYKTVFGQEIIRSQLIDNLYYNQDLVPLVHKHTADYQHDYKIKSGKISLKAISDNEYILTNEINYLPNTSYSHPFILWWKSCNSETKLKLLEVKHFKETEPYIDSNGICRIDLETDFKQPMPIGQVIETKIKLLITSTSLPPHINYEPTLPVVNDLLFEADLKFRDEAIKYPKLWMFPSKTGKGSLVKKGNVKIINNTKLIGKIQQPTINHIYSLRWNHCACQWCRLRSFNSKSFTM